MTLCDDESIKSHENMYKDNFVEFLEKIKHFSRLIIKLDGQERENLGKRLPSWI